MIQDKTESISHPVDIHVGKRLRLRRTIMGLSQEVIGTAIGVTFQQIQKYERGANRMGSSRLYEFSKILKVPVSYFFEGFEAQDGYENDYMMAEPKSPEFEHEQLSSRETMEMMRAYYKITSPRVRKSVFDLVKNLAEREEDQ